jgi:methylmalonyl-CoA/ethylmalonyl-CoA epimerase
MGRDDNQINSRPDITGIGHVGIVVKDLDGYVERLARVLGTDDLCIYDFQPIRAWVKGVDIHDCKFRIAMASFKNGSSVEIIEPVSGKTPHMDFISSGRQGMHHIAFYTGEYDRCIAYFKGLGIPILFEAEAEDDIKGYRRCFYAEDPILCCIVEFTETARFRNKQIT